MTLTERDRWTWSILALVLTALGLALRAWHTTSDPLWLDEAYSLYAAQGGWRFLWTVVPTYETHPPFYYSLVRLWTLLFGDGLLALRALGYVAGMATIPVTALAAAELARRFAPAMRGRMTIAAAVLATLSPPLVEMSREVRPYPVMILVYAIAIWALLRSARAQEEGRGLGQRWFALYCVMFAAMLWLHNLGPLYGAALGLAALLLCIRPGLGVRGWAAFVIGHLLVGVAWLPGLLILLDQAPTWVKSTWLEFGWEGMHWKLLLLWGAPGPSGAIATALLAPAGFVALARAPGRWREAVAIGLLATLPVIVSLAISEWVSPVFIVRTMTPVAIPALLLIAAGIAAGWSRWPLVGLVAGAMLAGQMLSFDIDARRSPPPQDWYGTMRFLARRFRPGDLILAYPNEGALPFAYAVRDLHLPYRAEPIPGPVPTLSAPGGWHPTGSRGVLSLPQATLRRVAERPDVRRARVVWLLRLGAGAYDKGDIFLHELERAGRTGRARYRAGPIDLIGLVPTGTPAGPIAGVKLSPAPNPAHPE